MTQRTAILTGATGGIGKAILAAMVKENIKVVASGTREEILKEICAPFGDMAIPITCNLKDPADIKEFVTKAKDILGKIDILVCNAGVTKDGLSIMMKEESWDEVIDVNLKSTFLLNQAVSKIMLQNSSGRIINISSVIGVTGNAGQVNYAASKAGMIGMTKSFALEFAKRNITANCVAPGFIASPMTDKLSPELQETIKNKIPMQRIGLPEEVAHCVMFLASEKSSYITGHTLHVNGGMLMV